MRDAWAHALLPCSIQCIHHISCSSFTNCQTARCPVTSGHVGVRECATMLCSQINSGQTTPETF